MPPGQQTYRTADPRALDELVRASGLSFRENSRSWMFTCPRCGKEDKLYMLKANGRFVCWVCKEVDGFQGRPEYALTELLARPIKALRKVLYGIEDPQAVPFLEIQLQDFFDDDEVDEDACQLEELVWPPDFYPIDHKFSARGLAYLNGRGVSLDLAKSYELRYCPPQRRVIFPIQSQGRLYGWQGRAVMPTEYEDPETGETFTTPKIVTPLGVKKERMLMFADRLLGSDHVIICEGPLDAIKADLCGGNVATMGKAVSMAQINTLRNSGISKVYLALDPDASNEVLRVLREFSPSDFETYVLRPPEPFKDLGEMSPEDVLLLFRGAERINAGRIFAFVETDIETLDRRRLRWQDRFRRGRAR